MIVSLPTIDCICTGVYWLYQYMYIDYNVYWLYMYIDYMVL